MHNLNTFVTGHLDTDTSLSLLVINDFLLISTTFPKAVVKLYQLAGLLNIMTVI